MVYHTICVRHKLYVRYHKRRYPSSLNVPYNMYPLTPQNKGKNSAYPTARTSTETYVSNNTIKDINF